MINLESGCMLCGGAHSALEHCMVVESAAAEDGADFTLGSAAIIVATKNAGGEVRLALRRLEKRTETAFERDAERNFISSDELQENEPMGVTRIRAGFGELPRRTMFTRHAKRLVREGVQVLHEIFGKQCVFATGTLPGSSPEALRALACWSGYVNSRLNQWVRDNAPGAMFAWVWELQKRGALHIHLCAGSHDILELRRLERGFRAEWVKLMVSISAKSGVDCFGRVQGGTWAGAPHKVRANCRPVQKNVAAYMSKYLSKSANQHAPESAFCPSRWWGISNSLRDEVNVRRAMMVSPVVPWGEALDLFERLAGGVAAHGCPTFVFDNPWAPGDRTLVACPDEVSWRQVWGELKEDMRRQVRRSARAAETESLQLPAWLQKYWCDTGSIPFKLDCDLYAYLKAACKLFDGFCFGYHDAADDGEECDSNMNCCKGDDTAFLRVL